MARPTEETSLHAARTRKERALADLREDEVRKRRGELLERDAVLREWSDIVRKIRTAVLGIPKRARQALPDLAPEAAEVIDRECRAALRALGEDVDEEVAPT